jgi:hypothetical protein
MRLGQMEITLYLAPLLQPVEAADQEALPLEMVALAAAEAYRLLLAVVETPLTHPPLKATMVGTEMRLPLSLRAVVEALMLLDQMAAFLRLKNLVMAGTELPRQ